MPVLIAVPLSLRLVVIGQAVLIQGGGDDSAYSRKGEMYVTRSF